MLEKNGGKYEQECTFIRKITNANGVILIVLGGDKKGTGASIQAPPSFMLELPDILIEMAQDIQRDIDASTKKELVH